MCTNDQRDHSDRLYIGLKVLGLSLQMCPFQRSRTGSRKNKKKKCFALSHIPLKEFLDIKAGVMTVKVGKFLLTQRLSRTHLESRCVLPKCVIVVLCIPVL